MSANTDMGRAHQGAIVILAVAGAGYTPPATPDAIIRQVGTSPRARYKLKAAA